MQLQQDAMAAASAAALQAAALANPGLMAFNPMLYGMPGALPMQQPFQPHGLAAGLGKGESPFMPMPTVSLQAPPTTGSSSALAARQLSHASAGPCSAAPVAVPKPLGAAVTTSWQQQQPRAGHSTQPSSGDRSAWRSPAVVKRHLGEDTFYLVRSLLLTQQEQFMGQVYDLHRLHRTQQLLMAQVAGAGAGADLDAAKMAAARAKATSLLRSRSRTGGATAGSLGHGSVQGGKLSSPAPAGVPAVQGSRCSCKAQHAVAGSGSPDECAVLPPKSPPQATPAAVPMGAAAGAAAAMEDVPALPPAARSLAVQVHLMQNLPASVRKAVSTPQNGMPAAVDPRLYWLSRNAVGVIKPQVSRRAPSLGDGTQSEATTVVQAPNKFQLQHQQLTQQVEAQLLRRQGHDDGMQAESRRRPSPEEATIAAADGPLLLVAPQTSAGQQQQPAEPQAQQRWSSGQDKPASMGHIWQGGRVLLMQQLHLSAPSREAQLQHSSDVVGPVGTLLQAAPAHPALSGGRAAGMAAALSRQQSMPPPPHVQMAGLPPASAAPAFSAPLLGMPMAGLLGLVDAAGSVPLVAATAGFPAASLAPLLAQQPLATVGSQLLGRQQPQQQDQPQALAASASRLPAGAPVRPVALHAPAFDLHSEWFKRHYQTNVTTSGGAGTTGPAGGRQPLGIAGLNDVPMPGSEAGGQRSASPPKPVAWWKDAAATFGQVPDPELPTTSGRHSRPPNHKRPAPSALPHKKRQKYASGADSGAWGAPPPDRSQQDAAGPDDNMLLVQSAFKEVVPTRARSKRGSNRHTYTESIGSEHSTPSYDNQHGVGGRWQAKHAVGAGGAASSVVMGASEDGTAVAPSHGQQSTAKSAAGILMSMSTSYNASGV